MPNVTLTADTKKTLLLGTFLCIVLVAIFGMTLANKQKSRLTLSALGGCFSQANDATFKPRCLDNVITILLKDHSTAELMSYITATTSAPLLQSQCHPVGHMIGELTYEKYGSMEAALAQCRNNCRFSCVHGVIGAGVLDEMGVAYPDQDVAHSNLDELTKIGTGYCKKNHAVCHAVGHIAYIASKSDTNPSLHICDTVSGDAAYREACYQGVFMERAGTFINVLFPLSTSTKPEIQKNDYTFPCTSLASKYRHACFIFLNAYQEPLFQADKLTSAQARLAMAVRVCETLSVRNRALCFEGIGTSASLFGVRSLQAQDVQKFCDSFSTFADRAACTLGILPQFYYQDLRGLLAYCKDIKEDERKSICFYAAFQFSEYQLRSAGAPSWCREDKECADRFTVFERVRTKIPNYRFGLFGT
jgi:hypothetical protein